MQFPLDKHIVDSICRQFGLRNFHELGNASIRQLAGVVKYIEQATGVEYVNMALGDPGLPASEIGIEAEHQALIDAFKVEHPDEWARIQEEAEKRMAAQNGRKAM